MHILSPRIMSPTLCLAALLLISLGCVDSGVSGPIAPEPSAIRTGDLVVPIQVAPATLVLDSPGEWVTVHAEIAYSDVDHATISLNDISPRIIKSDNRGELVAKFAREDIDPIVSPPEATLTLEGITVSGVPFSGSQTIAVR